MAGGYGDVGIVLAEHTRKVSFSVHEKMFIKNHKKPRLEPKYDMYLVLS